MSISISAYTGFYIKAPRPDNSGSVLVSACPKHGEMEVVFCPTCGLQTVPQAKFIECLRSISELIYDPEADWIKENVSEEDVEWIQRNVTFVDAGCINGDDDFDYFFIGDDFVYIEDAWDGAVQNIDLTEDVCKPEQEDVDRVLKIVGYQSYEMHFGTLIHVSN
jgi:hypothetical protein